MTAELRDALFARLLGETGEGVCVYCGKRVSRFLKLSDPRRATLDHLVPLSKGGGNESDNFVIACRSCNSRKGSLSADRFRQLRKRIYG